MRRIFGLATRAIRRGLISRRRTFALQRAVLAIVVCACAGPANAQSVASLFTTLPSDFAHLFTPTNGIVAGIGGAGSLAVHPKDDEIAEDIYDPSGARRD